MIERGESVHGDVMDIRYGSDWKVWMLDSKVRELSERGVFIFKLQVLTESIPQLQLMCIH
jgi:hypothetical protein